MQSCCTECNTEQCACLLRHVTSTTLTSVSVRAFELVWGALSFLKKMQTRKLARTL